MTGTKSRSQPAAESFRTKTNKPPEFLSFSKSSSSISYRSCERFSSEESEERPEEEREPPEGDVGEPETEEEGHGGLGTILLEFEFCWEPEK